MTLFSSSRCFCTNRTNQDLCLELLIDRIRASALGGRVLFVFDDFYVGIGCAGGREQNAPQVGR